MPRLPEISALFFFRLFFRSNPLYIKKHTYLPYISRNNVVQKKILLSKFLILFRNFPLFTFPRGSSFRMFVALEIWDNRWVTRPLGFRWSGSLISIENQNHYKGSCASNILSTHIRCIIKFPNVPKYLVRICGL